MAEFEKASDFSNLKAIGPLDGRFRGNIEEVPNYFSEYATMKARVELEVEWLIYINEIIGEEEISHDQVDQLRGITNSFSLEDAQWIEDKDLEINHDTKSAEYYLRMKMEELGLEKFSPLVHIGLTSADIDDNAVRLCIKNFEEEYISEMRGSLLEYLKKLSIQQKDSVFLAKTHGKEAIPTTMGKEFANYHNRLNKLDTKLRDFKFEGKLTGAVGNFNALYQNYPNLDWKEINSKFLENLGLQPNMLTTQILPYENLVEYLNFTNQYNNVLIDLARNMWTYISEGYIKLQINKQEVGSSTMAHKVNPISFEGCESHLTISNGIIEVLARNLPTNRLQRDLTDKYITRELGPSLANAVLGYSMIYGGITHVDFNKEYALERLNNHWEILSEPMQTILREYGHQDAYEVIKDKTRGKTLTKDQYLKLVEELDISEKTKTQLKRLKPEEYIGWAKDIIQ
jgi:adenylosuccinate lyase